MAKILVTMNNMKTAALTLQEQIARVDNVYRAMLVSFGMGQMATQTEGMKTYADALHHAERNLNSFSYAVGSVYGAVQSLGNYILAGLIEAFSAVIGWVKDAASVFSNLTPAMGSVSDVFRDIGTAAKFLGSCVVELVGYIGQGLIQVVKGVVELFNIWVESCALLGRLLGGLTGLIAGGLVNAFNAAAEALKPLISSIKSWIDDVFPAWGRAIDSAIEAQRKYNATLGEDRARKAAEGIKANSAALEENARNARNATLEQENYANAARKAANAAAAAAEDLAKKNILYGPDPRDGTLFGFKKNADGTWGNQSGNERGGGGGDTGGGGGGPGVDRRGRSADVFIGNNGGYAGDVLNILPDGRLQEQGRAGSVTGTDGQRYNYDQGYTSTQQPNGMWLNEPGMRGTGPQNQFDGPNGQNSGVELRSGGGYLNPQLGDPAGLENAMGELRGAMDELRTTNNEGANATADNTGQIMRLGTDFQNVGSQMEALGTGLDQAGNTFESLTSPLDGLDSTLSGLDSTLTDTQQSLDNLGNEVNTLEQSTYDNTGSTMDNTSSTEYNTGSTDASTDAIQANTESQYATSAVDTGGGGGGDSGGNPSAGRNDTGGGGGDTTGGGGGDVSGGGSYFDVGGVVGQWGGRTGPSQPASTWVNAPHFDEGGLTGGGIPIIAHANEAVVPLRGGAIPVSMGNSIPQAVMNLREAVIASATLAHTDSDQIYQCLLGLEAQGALLLAAFNSSSRGSSTGGGSVGTPTTPTTPTYTAHNGEYSGTGEGGGGGTVRRGYYGSYSRTYTDPRTGQLMMESNGGRARAVEQTGGYGPNGGRNSMYYSSMLGWVDALGRQITMAGADLGMENTNAIPGMSSKGAPITVHPNEAIVPLPNGRSIPVTFPMVPQREDGFGTGSFGGGQGNGGSSRGTTINNHNTWNIVARDAQSFGRGQTQDQIVQRQEAQQRRSVQRLGLCQLLDDPTVRINKIKGRA